MNILNSLKVMAGVALSAALHSGRKPVHDAIPSGVFVPTLTTGKRNAARAAAFRASVNRRKPGRYRVVQG